MDANLLRSIGIALGSAALAGALWISQAARDSAAVDGPLGITTPQASAAPSPPLVFEPAGAEAPSPDASHVSLLVRFRGSGPLAQAQALAERGRESEAGRAAAAALSRQSAFRGLCFDRFTVGGAEMVLRSCVPVAAGDVAQTSAQWLARLRAMPAVVYAEPNATAAPAQPQ